MPVETSSLFAEVIQDHLELKEKNAELETSMPLGNYKSEDPFDNHPLFKTEEQARLEETLDGTEPVAVTEPTVLAWPGDDTVAHVAGADDEGLWTKSRDFDWGD
ncbi:MAG TPA: hypothetical protein VEH52_08255 [Gaiellaceae bacterium]|jgi:hypothetical protein|nr:hypothetical protein [Gaiellaceae bacterium]